MVLCMRGKEAASTSNRSTIHECFETQLLANHQWTRGDRIDRRGPRIFTAIATSKTIEIALGAGAAIFVVQSITVPLNSLLNTYLFKPGALQWMGLAEIDISALGLIAYNCVIATIV